MAVPDTGSFSGSRVRGADQQSSQGKCSKSPTARSTAENPTANKLFHTDAEVAEAPFLEQQPRVIGCSPERAWGLLQTSMLSPSTLVVERKNTLLDAPAMKSFCRGWGKNKHQNSATGQVLKLRTKYNLPIFRKTKVTSTTHPAPGDGT